MKDYAPEGDTEFIISDNTIQTARKAFDDFEDLHINYREHRDKK